MKFLILMFLFTLSSCSSLKKSMIYSGLSFGAVGGLAGASLSPDKYSKPHNAAIWGGVGAILGAGLAYMFWNDDPENNALKPMIIPGQKIDEGNLESSKQIVIPEQSSRYKLNDLGVEVPSHIKEKLPKAYVIEHVIPERTEKLNNGKSISIESHKAYEVSFE